MGPLDRMILAAVKCIHCGAGYGKCDCGVKYAEERREIFIAAETKRLLQLRDDELIAECEKLGVKI